MATKAATPLTKAELIINRARIEVTADLDVLIEQNDRLSRLALYVLDGVLCNETVDGEASALVLEITQNAQACAARLAHCYYEHRIEELKRLRLETPKDGA